MQRVRLTRQMYRLRPSFARTETPLTPAEIRDGLRLSIVEGALANVHLSVTTNAFLTGFGLLLGANAFELGLLAAMPFVGQLFQFVGAFLEERLGTRRPLAVMAGFISRTLWAVMAALPFMAFLNGAQVTVFILLLGLSQAFFGIGGNVWMSWMTDLVPARERGRYFGKRNTVAAVAAMIATWLAGRTLDIVRANGDERWGYVLIFGVAVVCAIAASVVLSRQPEPPMPRRERVPMLKLLRAPLAHARFRRFSMAAMGWALVTGISAPFFNAYGIQTLNLSFAVLALQAVVTSAVSLLTQPYIGRLQDRLGDKTVLSASVCGTVLLPWGWVLSTPDNILPLWLTAIFSGVFWPGITQGLVNLLMDRAPDEGRAIYLASFAAISGAGTFAASILGGILATLVASTTLHLGPIVLVGYASLFVLSSLGRLSMIAVFSRSL